MQRIALRILAPAALAVLAALVFVHFRAAMELPLPSYDGRVIWEFKSRVFFERGTQAPELKNSDLLIPHADYPAFLPLVAVELASQLGSWSPGVIAGLVVMMFAGSIYLLIWHSRGSPAAMLAVAAWGFTPAYHLIYESCIRSGTADIVVGAFVLGAGICAVRAVETGRILYLAGGSLMIGLAAATKFDGLMWAIAFIPVGFAMGGEDREWLSRGLQITAACGIGVIVVAAPWLRMTIDWSSAATEPYFYRLVTFSGFLDFGRWATHAGQMLAELLLRPGRSSLPVWLAGITTFYAFRRARIPRIDRALLYAAGLHSLCLLCAYQISPWPAGEQVPVSYYRLLLQAAPLLTLVAVRNIRRLEEASPAPDPVRPIEVMPPV